MKKIVLLLLALGLLCLPIQLKNSQLLAPASADEIKFTEVVERYDKLPQFRGLFKLQAGEKITDIPGLVTFAQKTVPVGKIAWVTINIEVEKLTPEE